MMNALDKLDPDKNGMDAVLEEITSSTLTTRLKGVCKINRVIEYSGEMCRSFKDIEDHARFQETTQKFRDWILKNKIIEHIFGPNCHVEIIKQSNTILSFVAFSLNEEHVNVIWSASLLKHCGRQVLDLLTSLIRFMRTGPVLRLYSLVKSLNIEEHSEHTLLLTSHILRFIWSHSPCINQPVGDVKQSVVDHILKSISDDSSQSSNQQQQQQHQHHHLHQHHNNFHHPQQHQSQQTITDPDIPSSYSSSTSTTIQQQQQQPPDCNLEPGANEREWLKQWKEGNDFMDNTSDVSACCSEEKDMNDFEDDSQEFNQDENTISSNDAGQRANTSSGDLYCNPTTLATFNQEVETTNNKSETQEDESPTNRSTASNVDNRGGEILSLNDSTSTSRDSESKFCISLDQPNVEQFQQLPLVSVDQFKELKKASYNLSNVTSQLSDDDDLKGLTEYNLGNLSDRDKTLLWDLLQDGNIEHLPANLHAEIENVLVNLVMSFGDRYIRYKFIEACLENLSVGTSVIISLRLLPKLMSFNTITRNLSVPAMNETHTIVLWAEREYNMSQNFFKNLVEYYEHRRQILGFKASCDLQETKGNLVRDQMRNFEDHGCEQSYKSPLFSHLDKIITRMSFLTFIYSKPFSPESMKLSKEQMDQLWDCLASDGNLRCSDVLFQWIYQQAVGDDFHGVNDELLDYVLKHKLPTLEPEHFRLRGLKLLEQLLWIRQDYECCHGLEHPATRLLWDIGLKAVDDEVSMAAIRILNHFYIYTNHQKSTKCDKGINFMNHCMAQLQSSLSNLTNLDESKNVSQLLDVMQKVILLIRTHLEVFKAHWSFYLRILQLNSEADLVSHRLNAYEIKLTMTIRLVCQAASSMDKTTIEVQAGDFVGELRAEIVKWWYSQVDRAYYEQSTLFSPTSSSTSPTSSSSSNVTTTNPHDEASDQQHQQNKDKQSTSNHRPQSHMTNPDPSSLNPFTEFLLANHHSLRLLSHNQEIPFEWDERQINELDFKDMQVIYVINDIKATSVDSTDDLASDKSNESTPATYLPKTEIPSILLLRYEYFERLMEADRFLGSLQSKNIDLTNRAKILSRRVWEIIQILPTCPHYKEDLKRCGSPDDNWRLKSAQCSTLLSIECPQRLLYSLQIIDILKSSHENPAWGSIFIRKGGLADIYDVFMSQRLLPEDDEDWNEWLQECLAYLLKLLFQFGTKPAPALTNESSSSSSTSKLSNTGVSNRTMMNSTNTIKRVRRNRNRLFAITEERLPIPQFSDELLKLLANTDLIFDKLIRILKSSAHCRNQGDQYYYVTMSSRAMIVHHVMSFLSSWCKSDPKFPKFQIADYENLLKALILDDTDSSTRREACNGFYKLYLASSTKSANTSIDSINSTLDSSLNSSASESSNTTSSVEGSTWSFSADLLKCLVKFLPIAEAMRPPKPIRNYVSENDYIKELNSPGCKDYFWLTCRLIDSAPSVNFRERSISLSPDKQREANMHPLEDSKNDEGGDLPKSKSEQQASNVQSPATNFSSINLFELCQYLVVAIRNRQVYETRDFSVEDDTLRGMLLMMVMALRRDPTFRYTETAFDFTHELYEYLFAPPTQSQRYLPKCKSPATRSTAFDLMVALVERCPRNYVGLLELLLVDQHNTVVKGTYPTDYWPHDDCRSEVGFVGLINLGATCYLATCMQHLFMIPNLRYAILSIEDTKSIRHGEIIRELQKIFTFMLESERKAYNPRNFCKVYTMDNHPLNIAEQTDMTEFLTDLITKLEESSPELRQIIKGLFSGTLSNNVVSLDCPHISRTTEEFYTLRVQVADMRNLNDSLDELTVKDTLEGDNMYTCSTCEKKVRAEKRACIVKLPRILCFNTMRYTFNMATMTKEKVNTHFSFPLKLDMADYLETNLMKRRQQSTSSNAGSSYASKNSPTGSSASSSSSLKAEHQEHQNQNNNQQSTTPEGDKDNHANHRNDSTVHSPTASDCSSAAPSISAINQEDAINSNQESDSVYELIGVTVHTGNADGGHYYCFIRDCEDQSTDKPRWYLFNDAEVKPFDDSHIGTECYGGELTTKSYDAINDRFMDFSIEKTNSAYMLFYKRVDYKYHSRSVALRYLASDTQRSGAPGTDLDYGLTGDVHMKNCSDQPATNEDGQEEVDDERATVEMDANMHNFNNDEVNFSDTEREVKEFDFNELCQRTYEDFKLPKCLANWIWNDNMKFSRDKNVFEHNYFNFMWQVCANIPRALNHMPDNIQDNGQLASYSFQTSEDTIAIRTVHLAIAFVLGVLMNSRERPNLSNWTELIRKQFNSSKAACDWLMHLIDDEETWLKQMLLKCPIEMVRQLFQRLCNDLTGSKQHKKLRLIR